TGRRERRPVAAVPERALAGPAQRRESTDGDQRPTVRRRPLLNFQPNALALVSSLTASAIATRPSSAGLLGTPPLNDVVGAPSVKFSKFMSLGPGAKNDVQPGAPSGMPRSTPGFSSVKPMNSSATLPCGDGEMPDRFIVNVRPRPGRLPGAATRLNGLI